MPNIWLLANENYKTMCLFMDQLPYQRTSIISFIYYNKYILFSGVTLLVHSNNLLFNFNRLDKSSLLINLKYKVTTKTF